MVSRPLMTFLAANAASAFAWSRTKVLVPTWKYFLHGGAPETGKIGKCGSGERLFAGQNTSVRNKLIKTYSEVVDH